MTYCLTCGHDHEPGSAHMVFGTPITHAFGIDLAQDVDVEEVEQPPESTPDDVTAMLEDYARLRDKEDRAREAKAADMRRYRANVRARRTPTPNPE